MRTLEGVLLLALDTATHSVSVALHDGSEVLAAHDETGAMSHGEKLMPTIARVLAEVGRKPDDLTDVAVGVGPGPYTGLRVGVVTALTLSHTLGISAHGVCSLDPLGFAAQRVLNLGQDIIVATDARRKEIYWARFDAQGRRTSDAAVARAVEVAKFGLPVVGHGGLLYSDQLDYREGPLQPKASDMAELVVAGMAEKLPLEPLYLRRPDAVPQVQVPI